MATGKTLTVYLAADTAKLRRGLNDADSSLSGFGKKLSGMVGPALIGATAAAGAFAVALAVDGVQAAIKEEAELTKLGTALNNLGFAAQTDEVNAFIDELQYSAGVTDSELRPAFQRLLTSTNDVTQSQKLLQLALDVSAGTGRTLEQTTQAISKAMDGNLGALGKLGAGIDSSTIKSKDLDGALAQLSSTFSGQATAAAGTLQGQMKILGIAFDELKESFGTGFLNGMQSASGSISEFADLLRESQDMAEELGQSVGELATELLALTNDAWKAYKAFDAWTNNTAMGKVVGFMGDLLNLANPFSMLRKALEGVTGATDDSTDALVSNVKGLILWSNTAMKVDEYVRGGYTGIPVSTSFHSLDYLLKEITKVDTKTTTATTSTNGMTKAVKEMDPALRKQIDLVKQLTTELGDAQKAVDAAREKMNAWQEDMAGKISSGLNLGAINTAAFDEEGKRTGESLITAFQKQVDQAEWFGNVLKRIDQQGGKQLVEALADLGPEAGGRLGQAIISEGLVTEFESRINQIKSTARTAADAMTPEFLIAGVNSAVQFLTGTQNALAAATSQLQEMGKAMGKTIGESAAAEIVAALKAAGVAQTSAGATLSGTTGVPAATASQIAAPIFANAMGFMPTQVAQAVARSIATSNARLGRDVQPVIQ